MQDLTLRLKKNKMIELAISFFTIIPNIKIVNNPLGKP